MRPSGMALAAALVAALVAVAMQVFRGRPPPSFRVAFDYNAILHVQPSSLLEWTKTEYQEIQVVDGPWGHTMFIDGDLQLASADEFIYHEAMAHVSLCAAASAVSRQPTHVLIIGGGDGGVCARVLQHDWVDRLTLVDIDAKVIDVSRRHFPSLARACFDDERTTLVITDAAAWIRERRDDPFAASFAAIIIDSTDFGVSSPLRTPEFYATARTRLAPKGILVHNIAGPTWTLLLGKLEGGERAELRQKFQALGGAFPHLRLFSIFSASYGGWYTALVASAAPLEPEPRCGRSFVWPPRLAPPRGSELAPRYYTAAMHRAAFAVPPFIEQGWGFELDSSQLDLDVDVVVVGGGAAGIAAAGALDQLGVGKVVLLEASSKLGGRLDSVEVGGVTANVGASWIHHAEGNPITKLAQRHGCRLKLTQNSNALFFSSHGAPLPKALAESTFARLAQTMTAFLRAKEAARLPSARAQLAEWARAKLDQLRSRWLGIESPALPQADSPQDDEGAIPFESLASALLRIDQEYADAVATAMSDASALHPQQTLSAEELSLLELHAFRNIVLDHTADLHHLSAALTDEEMYGGFGRDALVLDAFAQCAFEPILRGAPVKVELNTPVSAVRAYGTPWGPRVHIASKGGLIRAKRVVMALPLGVLKELSGVSAQPTRRMQRQQGEADAVREETPWQLPRKANPLSSLEPPLTAELLRAVSEVPVGRALRFALEFEARFWPDGIESLVLEGQRRGAFGHGDHLELTTLGPAAAVLVGEADGDYAVHLSALDDDALGEALWLRLVTAFGDETPKPKRLHARRYLSDPLSAGSFSFNGLAHAGEWQAAAHNMEGLHFAGEHTSPLFPGTVDGAYFSGIAAAHEIACAVGVADPLAHVDAELLEHVWQPHCLKELKERAGDTCRHSFWELYSRCRVSGTSAPNVGAPRTMREWEPTM